MRARWDAVIQGGEVGQDVVLDAVAGDLGLVAALFVEENAGDCAAWGCYQ